MSFFIANIINNINSKMIHTYLSTFIINFLFSIVSNLYSKVGRGPVTDMHRTITISYLFTICNIFLNKFYNLKKAHNVLNFRKEFDEQTSSHCGLSIGTP